MIGKRIAMRSLIHVVDKEEFTLFFSTSTEGQEIRDPKITFGPESPRNPRSLQLQRQIVSLIRSY